MTSDGTRSTQALEWIARLPLCGEPELAGLLDVPEHRARQILHGLVEQGWVETVEPGSPELEPRRLSFVREESIPAFAAALGMEPSGVPSVAPIRLRDTLERLASVGITVGVNRFLAGLAADVRRSGTATLADARSLPLTLRPSERSWLPSTDGYGCLRAGSLWAPFLVAWDRASAPDLHRRRRLAGWATPSPAVSRRWGAAGPPAVLVVCPSDRELRVWEMEIARREERAASRAEVLLTTRDELQRLGPGGAAWRRAGRTELAPLVELLGWGEAPPVTGVRLPSALDGAPPPQRGLSIREWALGQLPVSDHGPVWQRPGVLALVTSPDEKVLLEFVARHTLLSGEELAVFLGEPEAVIARRLEWLARCGAIGSIDDTAPGAAGEDLGE